MRLDPPDKDGKLTMAHKQHRPHAKFGETVDKSPSLRIPGDRRDVRTRLALDQKREDAARARLDQIHGTVWHDWLQAAFCLQRHAVETGDNVLATVVVRFVSVLVQIADFYHRFCKWRHIESDREQVTKVGEEIGVSGAAVYKWLNWAGLEAEDFRRAAKDPDLDMSLSRLVAKSDTAGPLLEEVMTQVKDRKSVAQKS